MNKLTIMSARLFSVLMVAYLVSGCAATNTFHQTARAGDTVAIAGGWQENWSRDNISVWVQPNGGTWTQYLANDPSIRAVVNFYPDPISSLVVSNRTGADVTQGSWGYGNNVTNVFTSGSRDWYNTVVFFDLPTNLSLGTANVYVEEVSNPNNFIDTTVEIVENVSGGKTHDFDAQVAGNLQRMHLASMERAAHYIVTMSGSGAVPQAVQLDFTHDPDINNGGSGKAYVVGPASGINNITWTDDGINLRVVILPAGDSQLASFDDLRFYVAGGVTSLTATNTQAFDINGATVTGVSPPVITPRNIVISTN